MGGITPRRSWHAALVEALQWLEVNNPSGVGRGMEAAVCGEGEKNKTGERETFIVKQPELGSWLLLGLLQEPTLLAGRVGIGFPCQSGADGLGHGV